nr:MAG TPA: Single strand binding protein [Caudoviricetes sp.]
MADINTCTFTGRLAADPEVKQTQSGKTVARFRLAVGGFRKDETYWLDFEAWGKTAEALANYRHKGDPVGVVAHAVVDQWEKDGQKHSRVKFIVDNLPLNAGSCKHQQATQSQGGSYGGSYGAVDDQLGEPEF